MFIAITTAYCGRLHTDEETALIQKKESELEENQLVYLVDTGTGEPDSKVQTVIQADGSPVKVFLTQEAADDYVAFINSIEPAVTDVKTFDTEDELKEFLKSLA